MCSNPLAGLKKVVWGGQILPIALLRDLHMAIAVKYPTSGAGHPADRLLADRPVDNCGKYAKCNTQPPYDIETAIDIKQITAEPDTEKRPDLVG